jgi:2-polyprenyl-6-methoxyphenol hydroxylase-like FAD-dependent oxidoreductase
MVVGARTAAFRLSRFCVRANAGPSRDRCRCDYHAECDARAQLPWCWRTDLEASRAHRGVPDTPFPNREVIKIRANGTDYVERFGATYHQVHRADLHAALADALVRNDPNCVFRDHCFEALTQNSDHVVATFTNGKTYASDVLIGCDGGASKVRACVFGDEVVNYTGQVAFRALLPMSKVPPGVTKVPIF